MPLQQQTNQAFVAKRLPLDFMGEDDIITAQTDLKAVPLTVLTAKDRGPRCALDGRIIDHTILGDVDEYTEMERNCVTASPAHATTDIQPMDHHSEIAKTAHQDVRGLSQENSMPENNDQQLHIFQKYRELRQQHALLNWKRHTINWQITEEILSRRTNKATDNLLMSKLGEFRHNVEEQNLIEEAQALLESKNVQFWKENIWLGSDLLGLTHSLPLSGPREIERIHSKKPSGPPACTHCQYRERRSKELRHIVAMLDPHFMHNNGQYMEVEGASLSRVKTFQQNTLEYKDQYNSNTNEKISCNAEMEQEYKPIQENQQTLVSDPLKPDVNVVFSTKQLSFAVLLNQVSGAVFTVYNFGKRAFHFQWKLKKKNNPLKVKNQEANVRRFYFYPKQGVILPGCAFDFSVVFKSTNAGIYSETWKLDSSLDFQQETESTITLKGIALTEDEHHKTRNQFEKNLHHRVAQRLAGQIIDSILKDLTADSDTLKLRDNVCESKMVNFMKSIKDINVIFASNAFGALNELAKQTLDCVTRSADNSYLEWNGSIYCLQEMIMNVQDLKKKSSILEQFNVVLASISTSSENTHIKKKYDICYDAISHLLDKVVEFSDLVRQQLKLPVKVGNIPKSLSETNLLADKTLDIASSRSALNVTKEDTRKLTTPATTAPDSKAKKLENMASKEKEIQQKKSNVPDKKLEQGKKNGPTKKSPDTSTQLEALPVVPQLSKLTYDAISKPLQPAPSARQKKLEAEYRQILESKIKQLMYSQIDKVICLFEDVSAIGAN
ncbi:MYCBP-associated protein family-domain-containing protein [Cladochytrium replicatum]|nr:MYCBP-associated protein family-domain-containing protein [Cladochytrium replicatum]